MMVPPEADREPLFLGGRLDFRFVVSIRPGARNNFTYFFVYSARCSDAPARGLGQSRGHQWGGRR